MIRYVRRTSISDVVLGLADVQALTLAVSTYQACHFIGLPECAVSPRLSCSRRIVSVLLVMGQCRMCCDSLLVINSVGSMLGLDYRVSDYQKVLVH